MNNMMEWQRLLSDKRLGVSYSKDENGRTQFEKDIDRIIFSRAFRRLGRKTQVHLLSKDDHIHTRLSHSLEVASVGRSLGVMVGKYLLEEKESEIKGIEDLPLKLGDIVQAACLVHDIGNPPFGHVLEEAIHKWFQEEIKSERYDLENHLNELERFDLKRFDGNAMAFRIVTYKEHYENNGGMRLTYATLGAMLKYPWTSYFTKNKKFSCFKTEYHNLCEVAKETGLKEIEKIHINNEFQLIKYARHPLAYLVEAADDICYRVLDIEDAIQIHLLQDEYFEINFLEILNEKKEIDEEQKDLLKNKNVSWSVKNGLLRGKMIGLMIKEIVSTFKKNYERIMEGSFESDLLSKTDSNSLCLKLKRTYKNEGLEGKIYRNERNLPLELGAYSVLKTLLETSMEAAHELYIGKKMSYKTEIVLKKIINRDNNDRMKETKNLYEIIMLFLDYITGMTDDYATFVNKQLIGLGN